MQTPPYDVVPDRFLSHFLHWYYTTILWIPSIFLPFFLFSDTLPNDYPAGDIPGASAALIETGIFQ